MAEPAWAQRVTWACPKPTHKMARPGTALWCEEQARAVIEGRTSYEEYMNGMLLVINTPESSVKVTNVNP